MKNKLILTIACLLIYSSCKKESDPVGPPGGGGGGGNSGTPVSNAARVAAITAVESKFASLRWQNEAADKQEMIHFLQGRPEFEAAGPSDGAAVWARFTDGRLMILADNRPPSDTLDLPDLPPEPLEPGGELPMSRGARLLNAMGTHYINTSATLSPMLTSKGYNVSIQSATVENLRAVTGDGVFYISSHGACGTARDGSSIYSIWTSTRFDTTLDASYMSDWANNYLVYFSARHNAIPGRRDTATLETHFAVTDAFVIRYMSFGEDAFIYLDACGASSNLAFRDACSISALGGNGVTAGWSQPVGDRHAADAAYFVFDRLLGSNRNHRDRENPPQRSFRSQLILQDLQRVNLYRYTSSGQPPTVSLFSFRPTNADFGILAPSIRYIWVNEYHDRIYIEGEFGTDPRPEGSVTINGQPLGVIQWSWNVIECSIPRTGPSSAGKFVVTVRGHSSNSVPLTEWRGEVRITDRPFGSVNVTTTYQLHFRADVHSFRSQPHETPQPAEWINTFCALDTRVAWSAGGFWSGSSSTPPCTWDEQFTQSNSSGTINAVFPPPVEHAFADARMYPREGRLVIAIGMNAHERIPYHDSITITCPGSPPASFSQSATTSYGRYDTLQLQFDQDFNITGAGSLSVPTSVSTYPSLLQSQPERARIEFSGMTALHPPSSIDTCAPPKLVLRKRR